LLVGHGDGLGPGDAGYKRLKKVINSGWARWLYSRLHPNLAMGLALYFSTKSRDSQAPEDEFLGPEREWLVAYSERKLVEDPTLDHCIFGHRHLTIDYPLSNGRSRYLNLGEWMYTESFVRLDRSGAHLLNWRDMAPALRRPPLHLK
jgi:UDP-2,3-diacylglucosamine hydrolase